MSHRLLVVPAAALVLSAFAASAEPETVTEQADYVMADSDTVAAARSACTAKAAVKALAAAGTLVSAESSVSSRETSGGVDERMEQHLRSWIGSVVRMRVLGAWPGNAGDHLTLTCRVAVTFDPAEVRRLLDAVAAEDGKRALEHAREPSGPVAPPPQAEILDAMACRASKVRPGMTYPEVVAYVGGPPNRVDPPPSGAYGLTYWGKSQVVWRYNVVTAVNAVDPCGR